MMQRSEQTTMWRTNDGLLAWASNAVLQLEETPKPFGIDPAMAQALVTATEAFRALTVNANDPTRRTPAVMKTKILARDALLKACRAVASTALANPDVDPVRLVDLKVTPRDKKPTPVPQPDTAPDMEVTTGPGRSLVVRLRGKDTQRGARPPHVVGARIYVHVGEDQPATLEGWVFRGIATRMRFTVPFPDSVSDGSKVWLLTCWVNARQFFGPASQPVWGYVRQGVVVLPQDNLQAAPRRTNTTRAA